MANMIVPVARISRPIGPNIMYPASPKRVRWAMVLVKEITHIVDFRMIQLEVDEEFGGKQSKNAKENGKYHRRYYP